jgi:YesN/AraC family two-component response regulator
MPIMGGMEMIGRIFEIDGQQPIIITTGYNDKAHTSDMVCCNILKPLDDEKLFEAIILRCLGECNRRQKGDIPNSV